MTILESSNMRSAILGIGERFDLRSVPFSRSGSFMCILEDKEDRSLYLSVSRSPAFVLERKNLIRIVPVVDNKEIPYEYYAEPGKMTINTYRGTAEICFADKKQIRIRGSGISLRFYFRMRMFENCSPKENGDFEIAYEILGKLLFVPIKGAVWCNAKWNCDAVKADDFFIDLIPPVETMRFETAIHEYYSNGTRDKEYVPFDDCVKAVGDEFTEFCKRFAKVPEKYAEMARLAAWTIWSHKMGPEGRLKNSVVYMSRTNRARAFGSQQCYQAMASCADVREAMKTLLAMFDYQNEAGLIPNNISDVSINCLYASSPIQGAALDHIFNTGDFKELVQEDYAELYGKISRYAKWLLAKRDMNKSGIPQYYHVQESDWIDPKVFRNGRPVQSGDLLALLVLLTEYCGKLAILAGFGSEADMWMNESGRLIAILENEFWDGRQFIGRDAQTGEVVDMGITASLLPIILGKRLGEEIVDVIAGRMASEKEYFNNILPVQAILLTGLMNAGRSELALEIAERYCGRICEADELTSEMAAAFLMVASYICGEGR